MPEGWTWDETLYAGSAPYYVRGRMPYAPQLAKRLAEALAIDGSGRLIDVGCGPGVVALLLAPFVAQAVGVDPDAGMLAEAERAAHARGIGNIRWVRARAEELPEGLGTFRVATFAQSFHWMDREMVAARIREMLDPGGVLVHISDLKTPGRLRDDLGHPAPPYDAIQDLVRQWLGPVRRAGQGKLEHGTPGGEAELLHRAGFAGPDRLVVPSGDPVERTADDIVAWVFSMSNSAPHLFGAGLDGFERELRQLLEAASPAGRFKETPPDTEVFVWHA